MKIYCNNNGSVVVSLLYLLKWHSFIKPNKINLLFYVDDSDEDSFHTPQSTVLSIMGDSMVFENVVSKDSKHAHDISKDRDDSHLVITGHISYHPEKPGKGHINLKLFQRMITMIVIFHIVTL